MVVTFPRKRRRGKWQLLVLQGEKVSTYSLIYEPIVFLIALDSCVGAYLRNIMDVLCIFPTYLLQEMEAFKYQKLEMLSLLP